ncbi:MAG: hypothetical protein ACRDK9_04840 [Solirubrobacterales bacterium]
MEALIPLALLACPIGMGLMMWFMAKGMRGEKAEGNSKERPREGSLADLKAEQARLGAEIERLGDGARERVASGSRQEG